MRTCIAILIERLSWALEDLAVRIDPKAAKFEADRQNDRGRVPLADFA